MQIHIQNIQFSIWANSKIINWLNHITDEQWAQPVTSSFNSIMETVQHIISAEDIWLLRVKVEPGVWLQPTMSTTKADCIALWQQTQDSWNTFAQTMTEAQINSALTFNRLDGSVNTLSAGQAILHCCNHSTQHRGQLITMLRQVGFKNISSIDMLTFFRL